MILWIAFAIAAAAVIAALAQPLLSERENAGASAQDADLAVYRDQLAEIETDRERGLIDPVEADSARAELARRLIQRTESVDAGDRASAPRTGSPTPQVFAYGTAIGIPLLAMVIYLSLGSPWMPGMPQSARLQTDPGESTVNELVARVEAQLQKTPEDGRGWDAIAPVYLSMRRFDDASNAYAQAIRIQGETTNRLKGFAESMVLANDGVIVEGAKFAYQRVLALDPASFEARFWLAMADEQEGKVDLAASGYRAVLAEAPDDAPWRSVVENRLKALAAKAAATAPQAQSAPSANGTAPESLPATTTSTPTTSTPTQASPTAVRPGPTAADIAAAQTLSKDDQQSFINSMVERLAGKLEEDPADFEGWLRLVRAYMVLGRKDEASQALATARKANEGDSEKTARLDALASELGLGT